MAHPLALRRNNNKNKKVERWVKKGGRINETD